MANQTSDSDVSLLSGIDLHAFWETFKLRWWVIPAVLAVAVGFLWAQESDLRTDPSSYYVTRTYEARDATAVLASVGIDPASVRAFPDTNNQLLVLQSAAVRDEISAQLGRDAVVTVTRSRPTFTLTDTLGSDGESTFVLASGGVLAYSFSCNEPVRADCESAIDAYVVKTVDIRRAALAAGLNDLQAVLTEVQRVAPDARVATQLAAIDVLIGRLDTPLLKISQSETALSATLTSVRRPTYTFGIAAGLLVSLLILLQLTYTDSRIRSMRQLTRLAGAARLLGHVAKAEDAVRDRRTAVAVHHALGTHAATRLRYLPLRDPLGDSTALQRIATMSGVVATISAPFTDLRVPELTTPTTNEVDVVVVCRNRDLRADLVEVLAALDRSGRSVAGVVLVD